MSDPHSLVYGGTLALDVPADAAGVYTIPIVPPTFAVGGVDPEVVQIPLAELRPGVLVIDTSCTSDADCNDNDACTDDNCDALPGAGACAHAPKPGWDPVTQCCNPANGAVVDRTSQNPCQVPSCSLGDGRGTLVFTPLPPGSPCNTNDPCKANESCTAAGQCSGQEYTGPACRKPRYITLDPADLGGATAIRVRLTSLHHPQPVYDVGPGPDFTAFEGEVRWVGPVSDCPDTLTTTFKCAQLQCAPHYADWSVELGGQFLHVTGSAVISSSQYDVEQLGMNCQGDESGCLDVTAEPPAHTRRFGDCSPGYQDPGAQYQSQPNSLDINASLDRLLDEPGSLFKPRMQIGEREINPAANPTVLDLSFLVDIVKGGDYPFEGPVPCGP